MTQPMLMVVLLVAFFALYGMAPRNTAALRLYLTVFSFLAFSIILVHYLSLLAQPVSITLLPFIIVERWGSYEVVSVDWGQVVIVLFLLTLRTVMKSRQEPPMQGEPQSKHVEEKTGEPKKEDGGSEKPVTPQDPGVNEQSQNT